MAIAKGRIGDSVCRAACLAGRRPRAVYGFESPKVSADGIMASLLAAHGVQVNLYRNGEDVVPLVPRLLHAWQHPEPLIEIGSATWPVPNVVPPARASHLGACIALGGAADYQCSHPFGKLPRPPITKPIRLPKPGA